MTPAFILLVVVAGFLFLASVPLGRKLAHSAAPPLPTQPAFGWARAGAPFGPPFGPCRVALTDYSAADFSVIRYLCGLLPHNGPHGGQHRALGAERCTDAIRSAGWAQTALQRDTGAFMRFALSFQAGAGCVQRQPIQLLLVVGIQNRLEGWDCVEQISVSLETSLRPCLKNKYCTNEKEV